MSLYLFLSLLSEWQLTLAAQITCVLLVRLGVCLSASYNRGTRILQLTNNKTHSISARPQMAAQNIIIDTLDLALKIC